MNLKSWSIVFISICLMSVNNSFAQQKHSFSYDSAHFLLDGKPFQMVSGEIHYPRVPREAWRQRMKMAKAMGLNTIGTYVFWNLHEPEKDVFDFSGNNDIAAFVKIAQEEGLWVVLRPSPYVCAEWEYGGYPYWLQNEKGLVVRSTEAKYMKEYTKYINEVGKQLAPLQVSRGGNILMVQVENEYGAYGSDRKYLELNKKLFRDAGFDGYLYTCDPVAYLQNGYLPGMLPAVNGIDNPEQVKSLVRKYHDGKGPYYVAEWYPAWFDWWGVKHHTVEPEGYAASLGRALAAGISINMYMFHGGTTRGFMNGANYYDTSFYEPQISSYDYDAPLDEAGNATRKFMLFREAIQKNLPAGTTLPEVPAAKPSMALPEIKLSQAVNISNSLPEPVRSATPLSFEKLKQAYGFVLYRTRQQGSRRGMLRIKELRDYGIVMVNGKKAGVLDRRKKQDSILLDLPAGMVTVDILVENMGRINYGPNLLKNNKGITEKVLFDGVEWKNWENYPLPFKKIDPKMFAKNKTINDQPVIRKGTFSLTTLADTYLDMRNWGKGVVWINGHNLGRYWEIGPQQTIYVPAEWLKKGQNEVVVLELLKTDQDRIKGLEKPVLDELKEN